MAVVRFASNSPGLLDAGAFRNALLLNPKRLGSSRSDSGPRVFNCELSESLG